MLSPAMAAGLLLGALVAACVLAALVAVLRARSTHLSELSLGAAPPAPTSRQLLLAIVEEACLRQGWQVVSLDDGRCIEARLGRERLLVDVLDPGLDEAAAVTHLRRTAALRARLRLRTGALIAFGAVSPETRRLGLKHHVEVVDGKELTAFLTSAGRPRTA